MSHQVCHDEETWVEENIQQPLEDCIEQDCNWWCLCCNKWFCFIVWVIVTVGNWVITTVCEIVADAIDLVQNIVIGLFDIIVGIFTGNWQRIVDGLIEVFGGLTLFAMDVFRYVTLGDLVGDFIDTRNKWRLRDYVRGLVEDKYTGDLQDRIKNALGLNSTGFGLTLECKSIRTYIRSDYTSQPDGTPDLILWLKDKSLGLDLKRLTRFSNPEYWNRSRFQVIGDSGDISESDIDYYVSSDGKGPNVKHFSIYCMDDGTLQTKLDTASRKASDIGLKFLWTKTDKAVTKGSHVMVNPNNISQFLIEIAGRHNENNGKEDAELSLLELCHPCIVGVFCFNDRTLNGYSAHLHDSICTDGQVFKGQHITGAVYRDRMPDTIWEYVPIHELGHTFGLCHVDGLDDIMVSVADHSWWNGSLLPEYLWLEGEPNFTFDEGKKVWDYIIANFPANYLANFRT